jgi:hypothetical protein
VKDHKWHSINFEDCPQWLKNEANKYKSSHHIKNQSVEFKGRHFRYILNFRSNDQFNIKRRLRRWVKIPTEKKNSGAINMKSKRTVIHDTKQQGMSEQEYLDFCKVRIGENLEQIKDKLLWQTKGKNQDAPLHWVKLKDCDVIHLQNIIINVKYIHPITKRAILSLLHDRWCDEQRKIDQESHKQLIQKITIWNQKGYSLDTIDKIINHAESKKENGATTINIGKITLTDNKDGVYIDRSSK